MRRIFILIQMRLYLNFVPIRIRAKRFFCIFSIISLCLYFSMKYLMSRLDLTKCQLPLNKIYFYTQIYVYLCMLCNRIVSKFLIIFLIKSDIQCLLLHPSYQHYRCWNNFAFCTLLSVEIVGHSMYPDGKLNAQVGRAIIKDRGHSWIAEMKIFSNEMINIFWNRA